MVSPINRLHNASQGVSYEIECAVGRGAFATVYSVRREGSAAEPLAAKVFEGDDIGAFYHERGILGHIEDHSTCPYLMRAVDWFQDEDWGCIVMKRYETTLERRCQESFTVAELSLWAYQLAVALDELHRLGIIHCNVEPYNILVSTQDGSVCLADFVTAIGRQDGQALYMPEMSRTVDDIPVPPEAREFMGRLKRQAQVSKQNLSEPSPRACGWLA